MSETPLANDASARDAAGTIVDQGGTGLTPETTQTEQTTESGKNSGDQSQQDQALQTEKKEGETLLTEDGKSKEGEKTEAKGPPEKYADYKLPEGVSLQPEVLEKANGLFKELGLTQDQAQKLIDLDVERAKALEAAPIKAYNEMREKWQAAAKADPDIGPKMEQVKQNVGKLYSAIGDAKLVEDFKGLMNLTGVGDNPAFIKVLNKLSEFVVEGKHVNGSGPSIHGQTTGAAAKPTAAQALYPNNPSSARS